MFATHLSDMKPLPIVLHKNDSYMDMNLYSYLFSKYFTYSSNSINYILFIFLFEKKVCETYSLEHFQRHK